MPGSTLIPSLRYRDAKAAIEWLVNVLGFERHVVYLGRDEAVDHAELTSGNGMIMLGSASNVSPLGQFMGHPDEFGGRSTSPLYLVVPDCEPIYARAQEHGADVVQELREMSYGGKAFTVRDPEGYLWSIGEYDPWTAPPQGSSAA